MEDRKFDPQKLDKLNDPSRLKTIPPEFIKEKVALRNPDVIVDLGAGTGFFSIAFAGIFETCKIYACDISDVMINWMKENVSRDFRNIIPVKMEEDIVPLENSVADFLFMINLHHELYNPEKTLKECHRILKPEGKIAISDWKKVETEKGPPVEIRYHPEEVMQQLLAAGFYNVIIYNELTSNFLVVAEKKA